MGDHRGRQPPDTFPDHAAAHVVGEYDVPFCVRGALGPVRREAAQRGARADRCEPGVRRRQQPPDRVVRRGRRSPRREAEVTAALAYVAAAAR